MAKLFKSYKTLSEYNKDKISISKDNLTYVQNGTAYTTAEVADDIVTYNKICFVEDGGYIYRNNQVYGGNGVESGNISSTYIPVITVNTLESNSYGYSGYLTIIPNKQYHVNYGYNGMTDLHVCISGVMENYSNEWNMWINTEFQNPNYIDNIDFQFDTTSYNYNTADPPILIWDETPLFEPYKLYEISIKYNNYVNRYYGIIHTWELS